MKSQIALIFASATLAITGANLKASAFEAHTPLNFSESTLNNTIGQQNLGNNQELLLLNQGVNKPKADNNRRTCKSLRCVIKDGIKNIEPKGDIARSAPPRRRSGRG